MRYIGSFYFLNPVIYLWQGEGDEENSQRLSDEDSQFEYDYSEDGDGDFDDNNNGLQAAVGDASPFAPAELYLSDLLDVTSCHSPGGSSSLRGAVHVYVPDDMVYSPHKTDPFCKVSVASSLKELFHEAEQDREGLFYHNLYQFR